MKYLIVISIVFIGLFSSCRQILGDEFMKDNSAQDKKSSRSENLELIIKSAKHEVSNIMIYNNFSNYQGKVIAALGIIAQQKFLLNNTTSFYLSGQANGYAVNFVINLDHPLKDQNKINEDIEPITVGKFIRIFGRLKEVKDFLLEDGSTRKLPVLEAIVIYSGDDRNFVRPLWLSLLYE
jgi:hypothetical protein